MDTRRPYTRDELSDMIARVDTQLTATERDFPAARPLPPLTVEECMAHLDALVDLAGTRPLTRDEQFLGGQLHSQLRQAVRAEMLGHPMGRYYVISEAEIARLQQEQAGG